MKELLLQLVEHGFKYCKSDDIYERYAGDGQYVGIKITTEGLEVYETPMYGGEYMYYKTSQTLDEAIDIIENELI